MPTLDPLLSQLSLPATLQSRILVRVPSTKATSTDGNGACIEGGKNNIGNNKKSYVLYLPTVVLRKKHNPAFALACHLANHWEVPVIVLGTLLDDQNLSHHKPPAPICATARRWAFLLEAYQSCAPEWESHGAGVGLRLQGPGARLPHHLTLAHQAMAVVQDEAFVEPYRCYLRKTVGTCQASRIPCYSVDGSTTVPPILYLKQAPASSTASRIPNGDVAFHGAPTKAWLWEKKTEPQRKAQIYGIVREGHLDAPPLKVRLPASFFLEGVKTGTVEREESCSKLPSKWKMKETPAPGTRPWTVEELVAIQDLKKWVTSNWPGVDISVLPCRQTHGSQAAAHRRWKRFRDNGGLRHYAKRRNQIIVPHSVSHVSCYLNMGILSIFDVVSDVWQIQTSRTGYSLGCQKFLEEAIKWREIGYVHSLAMPGYRTIQALPLWSKKYLEEQHKKSQKQHHGIGYTYEQLETCSTRDETWNAMQSYLNETGELHNNARMTWGKTVVHWQATVVSSDEILLHLCTLNDRFALDGLSPPSYAGLLWCFGWGDKAGAGGSVSTKWASRYRQGADGFEQAKERLLNDDHNKHTVFTQRTSDSNPQKKPRLNKEDPGSKNQKQSILFFFNPTKK